MFKLQGKALTFSYDDGVRQDARLAEIFNRYGLKCTFNINTGLLSPENRWTYRGADCIHMTAEEIKASLQGHELAVHGAEHLDLTALSYMQQRKELEQDKANILSIFGTEPKGMAYAYGNYNEQSLKIEKECGIKYARTVKSTHSFDLQSNLLEFNPTCHHNDERLFELAEQFLALPASTPALFYVWGHSYEFDGDGNWDRIEAFCRLVSGKPDIFYCTNSQALLGE